MMNDMSQLPDTEEAEALAHPEDTPRRKPRLAIMGEFSAGKSTLSNLLLGAHPLPEKVTATRLSPVWIVQGEGTPVAIPVENEDDEQPISLEDMDQLDVDATRYVRLSMDSSILEHCDLIDFPGISDPNMDSAVWERMLPEVDLVLWCTHATQAWRQSEAAAWNMVPAAIRARSMLLVTRFDKLTCDRDRDRVLARIATETQDLFTGIYPLSLLQALKAVDTEDDEAWDQSGARRLADDLQTALTAAATGEDVPEPSEISSVVHTPKPEAETVDRVVKLDAQPAAPPVVPRRVRAKGVARRPRPVA